LKKTIFLISLFLILLVVSTAVLFLKQFPEQEMATISASVGDVDDCEHGGSTKFKGVGTFIWWYLSMPSVSEEYVKAGNSFLSPAFEALICEPEHSGYAENLKRVKRLVLHGLKYGESIDHVGENGFNLMHAAVIHSDLEFATFLLEHGAKLSVTTSPDAVWYGKAYDTKNAHQLALALRENDWQVSDEFMNLINKK